MYGILLRKPVVEEVRKPVVDEVRKCVVKEVRKCVVEEVGKCAVEEVGKCVVELQNLLNIQKKEGSGRMSELAEHVKRDAPPEGKILLYWLGGVGYIIKSVEITVGLDIYLSDSCRNEKDDFKRLVPSPINACGLELDYLIATHEHGDHFDTGSIHEIVNKKTRTKLIGPSTVMNVAKDLGVDEGNLIKLDRNESLDMGSMKITGVLSDHGEYSPDAIGVIIEISGKRIYFTGDTCFRPDFPQLVPLKQKIDLLLVPINGKFGNPDAKDASYITAWVKPEIVIPCHFWMFKEHGGDPGEFVEWCKQICPSARIVVPAIGEQFSF